MPTGFDRASRDKSLVGPGIWRISHAEPLSGYKSIRAARICHVLQVDATGEPGLVLMAAAQRGVVHRAQLRALGIGRGSIAHRVSIGTLQRLFPRVFAVGHPALPAGALEVAAVLHAGDDSVISHASAAALWGFWSEPVPRLAVTVAGRNVRQLENLRIHRVAALDIRDVRLRWGLPITAPSRTLIDFAAAASADQLERALAEARVLRLINDHQLEATIARMPLRSGVGPLRSLLADERGPTLTRSEAERRLLKLIAAAELPMPRVNARVHGFEVDALWREQRLVVEVDGYAFHGPRPAFEGDRRRDQVLVAAGYRVLRVTWRQLETEPLAVVARIAQALTRRGSDDGAEGL